jgi:hypothetical protein
MRNVMRLDLRRAPDAAAPRLARRSADALRPW